MDRKLPWLVAVALFLPVVASAQQQQKPPAEKPGILVEVTDREDQLVPRFNISVSELREYAVYGADGERIGEIEDVLAGSDGKISAVTVEVGGFLGTGERDVVLPLDSIGLSGLRLVVDMTKDQIAELPPWEG